MPTLFDPTDPLIQLGNAILGMGVVMARWVGLALILPVFSRTGLTGLVRGSFVFAMSLPLLPIGLGLVETMDRSRAAVDLVLLVLKEGMIGVALGLLLGLPFWAAEMAGDILDVQRGSMSGTTADPAGMNQSSILGTFFAITSIALFLVGGGITVIVDAAYDSYRLWPLGDLAPDLEAGLAVFTGFLLKLTATGLTLAAPMVILALAGDVLLGLVSKLAPSLNIYVLGAILKSLMIAAVMAMSATFLLGDLSTLFGEMAASVRQLEARP